MYFNDHNPPHFHVKYENYRAIIEIKGLEIIDGNLPLKVLALVIEWASIYKEELIGNWNNLIKNGTFNKIKPLV